MTDATGSHAALPTAARIGGQTLEFWTGQWWTTLLQSPADHNTWTEGFTDVGKVTMLAGPPSGGSAEYSFKVDPGDAILVPVINFFDLEGPGILSLDPAHATTGFTDAAEAAAFIDEVLDNWIESIDWDSLYLKVDGHEVTDLASHLVRTDHVFSMGRADAGELAVELGVPDGADMPWTEAEGVMVMLHPLPKGEHTIEFGGQTHAVPDGQGGTLIGTGEFGYAVTDHILVG